MKRSYEQLRRKLDRAVRKNAKWAAEVARLSVLLTASQPNTNVGPTEEAAAAPPNTNQHTIPCSGTDIGAMSGQGKYRRAPGRVAAQCGVSTYRVWSVARGRQASVQIGNALIEELNRLDKEPDSFDSTPLFDKLTLAKFQRGGRYFGLQQEIARELGITAVGVSKTLRGKNRSPRTVDAIRRGMSARDADQPSGGMR